MDIAAIEPFPALTTSVCLHCGEPCGAGSVTSSAGDFCCRGCETVFTLLHRAGLGAFYVSEINPGTPQKEADRRDAQRFAVLDDPLVANRVMTFNDGTLARVTFPIPSIHCASCVWLLEQLWRFDRGVTRTEVDLLRRAVLVDFDPTVTSLRRIAEQLTALGYEPSLSPEDSPAPVPASRRRLHLQIGVAGLRVRQHHAVQHPALRERRAAGRPPFSGCSTSLNIAARDSRAALQRSRRTSAPPGRRSARRTMALEVPVALGLAVLFGAASSTSRAVAAKGFLDSFAGLVFFLLLGRLFQQKVFDRIAFDRTYRSFLPLSVRVERDGGLRAHPAGTAAARRLHRNPSRRSRARRCATAERLDAQWITRSSPVSRRRYLYRTGDRACRRAGDGRHPAAASAARSFAQPARQPVEQPDLLANRSRAG